MSEGLNFADRAGRAVVITGALRILRHSLSLSTLACRHSICDADRPEGACAEVIVEKKRLLNSLFDR